MQKYVQPASMRRLQPSVLTIALLSALCAPMVQARAASIDTNSGRSSAAVATPQAVAGSTTTKDKTSSKAKGKAVTLSTVTVVGLRGSIQSSISKKRDASVISDQLSAKDIGGMPALNIGDAIETLTGAATYRDMGEATEMSIRGLGPYLGATHIDGRQVTNGSGDRAVNFSMFPSATIQSVSVNLSQRADYVEGGISGDINLETFKPLHFHKRKMMIDLQGCWRRLKTDHQTGVLPVQN